MVILCRIGSRRIRVTIELRHRKLLQCYNTGRALNGGLAGIRGSCGCGTLRNTAEPCGTWWNPGCATLGSRLRCGVEALLEVSLHPSPFVHSENRGERGTNRHKQAGGAVSVDLEAAGRLQDPDLTFQYWHETGQEDLPKLASAVKTPFSVSWIPSRHHHSYHS